MGALLTQVGREQAKQQALSLEDTTPAQDKAAINVMYGILRATGQGATFGFGDEAEAYLRSKFSDRGYEEIRDEVRSKIDQFKDEETALAYGTEIAASVLSPVGAAGLVAKTFPKIASVAGQLIGGKYRQAIGGGALYGAGTAKEIKDVPLSATTGGLVGMGATALVPAVTEPARRAIKKGLSLSAGEKYGGIIGALESVGTGLIRDRFGMLPKASLTEESLAPALYGSVLKDLGKKLPTGADARKAFDITDKAFKDLYEDTLKDVSVKIDSGFQRDVSQIVRDYGEEMTPADMKKFERLVESFVKKSDDGFVSGESLKSIQTDINKRVRTLGEVTGEKKAYVEAIKDLDEAMMESFARADSPKSESLKTLNKAYAKYKPLEFASFKAGTTQAGAFSPTKLDAELKRQANRRAGGRKKFIKGELFGQEEIGLLGEVQPSFTGGIPSLSVLGGVGQLAPQAADIGASSLLGSAGLALIPAGAAVGLGTTKLGRTLLSPRIPRELPFVGGMPVGGVIDIPSSIARTPAVTGGIVGQNERAQEFVQAIPERAVGIGQRFGILGE